MLRRDNEQPSAAKLLIPSFQEKPLSFSCIETVPQTDTGGQDENSKALERRFHHAYLQVLTLIPCEYNRFFSCSQTH